MKKKLFLLFIMTATLLFIAACSSGGSGSESGDSSGGDSGSDGGSSGSAAMSTGYRLLQVPIQELTIRLVPSSLIYGTTSWTT